MLTNNSELAVLKADAKTHDEIAKYKVAETEIYAHPVIAKNRIYVKDQESLALWVIQ